MVVAEEAVVADEEVVFELFALLLLILVEDEEEWLLLMLLMLVEMGKFPLLALFAITSESTKLAVEEASKEFEVVVEADEDVSTFRG